MFSKILLLIFLLFSLIGHSQTRKNTQAIRVTEAPVIDGVLNDSIWQSIPVAQDFIMLDPNNGAKERDSHKTEVKIVYDDEALYVAAYLYDHKPEQILTQFSQRDDVFSQSDFFAISINTYDDGENETRFFITSAGTMGDAKIFGYNEDFSFDVVFEAEITIQENGWFAEMKIPFAALRFPKEQDYEWGLQFYRRIKHLNEDYTWNFINKEVGKPTQYSGLLTGISDIEPPLRLNFYPYVQGSISKYGDDSIFEFSAGMDLKYGITDAFTLDATLIPDFGQTSFDNQVLNLGPFEQTFRENRAFFTEGIDLFSKGGIFFSRRIGSTPTRIRSVFQQLQENEKIMDNPENVELLNAVKISGRLKNGLGIGVLNSITNVTRAVVTDTITGERREIITEPLANYNVIALDQQFKGNSSLSLVNTNVLREGDGRDANVTAMIFDLTNKANSFRYSGKGVMSHIKDLDFKATGYSSFFKFARTKGNFRYSFDHNFADTSYNINDLGLSYRNNYNNLGVDFSYEIFTPTKIFDSYRIYSFFNHERLYSPSVNTEDSGGGGFFARTKSRFAFGADIRVISPVKDFFEPRLEGAFVRLPASVGGSGFVSSDYRRKFAYDIRSNYRAFNKDGQYNYGFSVSPRYRFSDKIQVIYGFNYSQSENAERFVTKTANSVFFGERDVNTIENNLRASYNLDPDKAVNLVFRNFLSRVTYEENSFTSLGADGNLIPTDYTVTESNNPNSNFNIWNLDLSFSWRFAPGSEAVLFYRNSIFNRDKQSEASFGESIDTLFGQTLQQNVSLRIVYYIDYNTIRKQFTG